MAEDSDRINLLFICTGNTCRSPIAEALLKLRLSGTPLEDKLSVGSAGLMTREGLLASSMALEVTRGYGLDLESHRSRPLTREWAETTDIFVVMQSSHRATLRNDQAAAEKEILVLGEFSPAARPNPDIADPFGGDREVYEASFAEIRAAVEGLYGYLERRLIENMGGSKE